MLLRLANVLLSLWEPASYIKKLRRVWEREREQTPARSPTFHRHNSILRAMKDSGRKLHTLHTSVVLTPCPPPSSPLLIPPPTFFPSPPAHTLFFLGDSFEMGQRRGQDQRRPIATHSIPSLNSVHVHTQTFHSFPTSIFCDVEDIVQPSYCPSIAVL